jgi:hypothetical protein
MYLAAAIAATAAVERDTLPYLHTYNMKRPCYTHLVLPTSTPREPFNISLTSGLPTKQQADLGKTGLPLSWISSLLDISQRGKGGHIPGPPQADLGDVVHRFIFMPN